MKSLKSILAGITLLFVCVAVNASPKNSDKTLPKENVVSTYVDDISNAKTNNLNAILSNNLQFNMQRGDNLNTLTKDQFIAYMKNNATVDPSVKATTSDYIDDSGNAYVKVEFKYADYTRVDLLTLNDSNVITKVDSSFK